MKEGKCIMGEMRKDREGGVPNDVDGLIDHYRHEVRKGQEAYDQLLKELNMLRGTKTIVESLSTKNKRLQDEIDRIKKENNDLFNRIADALEVNESHQKYNGKLQDRLTELEQDNIELHAENKKINNHLDDRLAATRKSGM
jgi:predicted RNase H-like nuclease (RuvC/YqgF family)